MVGKNPVVDLSSIVPQNINKTSFQYLMTCTLFCVLFACRVQKTGTSPAPYQNTKPMHLKELMIKNAVVQPLTLNTEGEVDSYIFRCSFTSSLTGRSIYYKGCSGIAEKSKNGLSTSKLIKRPCELPRSVYPFLSQGYIVIKCSRFGFETYALITDFKVHTAWESDQTDE